MDNNQLLDRDDLDTLSQQLRRLRQEKAQAQEEVQRLTRQLESLHGSYADGYREADALQRELNESEGMLAVAKDANERAQARIDALERMAQEWKSRVDSLERERSATEVKLKESEVLEEKLKERDARMKELEKELKELEEKLEEGEAKRKEQDAKLQGQDTKLHEQDAKLQIQETKLHEFTSLDTKNKELQDTIASLTKERDALRQELQHSREPDVSAISEDMNTPSFSHTSPSPQPLVKDSLAPEPGVHRRRSRRAEGDAGTLHASPADDSVEVCRVHGDEGAGGERGERSGADEALRGEAGAVQRPPEPDAERGEEEVREAEGAQQGAGEDEDDAGALGVDSSRDHHQGRAEGDEQGSAGEERANVARAAGREGRANEGGGGEGGVGEAGEGAAVEGGGVGRRSARRAEFDGRRSVWQFARVPRAGESAANGEGG